MKRADPPSVTPCWHISLVPSLDNPRSAPLETLGYVWAKHHPGAILAAIEKWDIRDVATQRRIVARLVSEESGDISH